MSELREIFYTLPKISDKWDRYFDVYERHLEKFKGKNITLVEVGVQNGGSLDMWSKYLGPDSKIVGIDVDPACLNLKYDNPNIKIIIGDQASPEFWDSILPEIDQIDVLIDDGGHTMKQQTVTFEKTFSHINSNGGVFVCEDCHTSYWEYYGGGYKNQISFIEYAKNYIDVLNYGFLKNGHGQIEEKKNISTGLSGVFFYDSMVIFEKTPLVEMKCVFSKEI
jgi:hypothetical protein